MAKFLYLYTGGNPPASQEAGQKVMDARMADSLADAVRLSDGHPYLLNGGAIEVLETVPVPM